MLYVDKRKSREQNFKDFFESLQMEYIVAELRYKIYPENKQSNFCDRKQKSLDIMNEKKKRIIDIAIKNKMNTIFDDIFIGSLCLFDMENKTRLYSNIYTPYGLPNFIYRDDHQRSILEKYDKLNYYTKGESFDVQYLGVGTLINYDLITEECIVEVNGELFKNVKMSEIVRVFR